jgi:D-glycero-alpha-D-manno-heptose 1-phosphate guanylyltransferase
LTSTAIILAGGLGTRLRSVVNELPKCMAPVNGRPFIDNVIHYLLEYDVKHFIFSVGYKSEAIINHIQTNYPELHADFAIEASPLGTGGAIQLALSYVKEENTIIVNGDTIFEADLHTLSSVHLQNTPACTLALKPMKQFDRYGVVTIDDNFRVKGFQEKKYYEEGLINGGIYIVNKSAFLKYQFPEVFSFEKDFLEIYIRQEKIIGYPFDAFFIDIGIPEDYERAQTLLKI